MTKMKLAKVSKPSQREKAAIGSGNKANKRKTMGRSSQAMELLVEIVFFLREMTIMINRMTEAIVISIWMLVIFAPSETYY